MKLLFIGLRNFKGIKELNLDFRGVNASVYGANAAGKTTVFDAFTWLLFDKDSNNRKDFQIKTLGADGKPLSGLNHEVYAVLDVDGKKVEMKKVYTETWTKKRGSSKAEFTGHTTDYFLSGVPVRKKEFEAQVAEIADEAVFKLLTSPSYFNEQVSWQDRRKVLLEICGDIDDQDVIAANEKLAKLPELLAGRSIEDFRKIIAARKAEINKELEQLPARIDEVNRSLPDVSGLVEENLQVENASLRSQRQEKEKEIIRVQNGGEISKQQNLIREIEGKLLDFTNRFKANHQDDKLQKTKELYERKSELTRLEHEEKAASEMLDKRLKQVEEYEQVLVTLRAEGQKAFAEEFVFEGSETCPTCGQFLPEEKMQEARQNALALFNLKKSQRLGDIEKRGKDAAGGKQCTEDAADLLRNGIATYAAKKESVKKQISQMEEAVSESKEPAMSAESQPEYLALLKEKEAVQQHIETLRGQEQGIIQNLQAEISVISQDIQAKESKVAALQQCQTAKARVTELMERESLLGAEYERLEGNLFLTEEFIRNKVSMLEENINEKFGLARFKLFEVQVNGGLREVCETLYEGVPYSGGLNNAARINVGLDIINTLSEHYKFQAPIFIDNAESVCQLIATKGQVIRLVVSEKDSVLRLETQQAELKEAI